MPKRPAAADDGVVITPAKKTKSKRLASAKRSIKPRDGGGFRDKVRVKNGVVNYLFKPKETVAYNYGEIEVEKDWPARQIHQVKINPSGSPAYQPGQSVVSFLPTLSS